MIQKFDNKIGKLLNRKKSTYKRNGHMSSVDRFSDTFS